MTKTPKNLNKKKLKIRYIVSDYFSAALAWGLFFIFRKIYIEPLQFTFQFPENLDFKFYLGLLIIPFFWLTIYAISGYYRIVHRKSRLQELGNTFTQSLIGIIILFFILILDDTIVSYKSYYHSVTFLFLVHFCFTYFLRLFLTNQIKKRIRKGEIYFNTLLIGCGKKADSIINFYESESYTGGNKLIGYLKLNSKERNFVKKRIPLLGKLDRVNSVIEKFQIEEIIIAHQSDKRNEIEKILAVIYSNNLIIRIIPDMYDVFTRKVSLASIQSKPLLEIPDLLMPAWQQNIKRLIDIFASIVLLFLLSPLYIVLALGVKLSSAGSIFYKHERVGKEGKPFTIYKFRSMHMNAEKNGIPQLSSENDPRITTWGRFMRKYRLDELPQFYNVLIGDMSLVGPRPERQYYIKQIVKFAPHYLHLHKVRPGITSLGQVKYGYAENVLQMLERLDFDIIYIQNMSLYIDFKILIYTVLTILKAEGK